jgi:hypothetical protein
MISRFLLPILWFILSMTFMFVQGNDVLGWILLVGAVVVAKQEVILMKLEER